MDHDRRMALAALAEAALPALHRAVIDSWSDLMPVAARWSDASHQRAKAAAEATLRGLVTVIAQGDLDEEEWRQTRQVVFGKGFATEDEVGELLRTVRIVGVELLMAHLDEAVGLSNEERWALQQEAHTYSEELHRTREQVDPSTVQSVLEELAASGADLG